MIIFVFFQNKEKHQGSPMGKSALTNPSPGKKNSPFSIKIENLGMKKDSKILTAGLISSFKK